MRAVVPIALGVFFAIATLILLTAGIALSMPGSALDAIWSLNPGKQAELMPWRAIAGPGFLVLAIPMALASVGCFRHRPWARWLAIAIFAANGVGDAVQLASGRWLEGGVGVAMAGVLIWATWRSRAAFDCGPGALARESRRL